MHESLLKRALKLLDKGNVRYSDRIFEDERAKLVQDIASFLASAEIQLQQQLREKAEQHGQCSYCDLDIAVEGHAADCKRPKEGLEAIIGAFPDFPAPPGFEHEDEPKPEKPKVRLPVIKDGV